MKNDLIAAAQRALEVLEELQGGCTDSDDGTVEAITVWCPEIITALRAALEAPEPEPVAWVNFCAATGRETIDRDCHSELASTPLYTALYTAPSRREPLRTARESMKAEGWRQCAVGQRETQHCGLLETAVLAEREACARVCERRGMVKGGEVFAARIRARGNHEPR